MPDQDFCVHFTLRCEAVQEAELQGRPQAEINRGYASPHMLDEMEATGFNGETSRAENTLTSGNAPSGPQSSCATKVLGDSE